MKPTSPRLLRSQGFTLIEIIVTIIIGAILGALIVPFLGKALTASSVPIHRLSSAVELKSVIENITEDYEQDASNLKDLKKAIGKKGDTESNNYGQYKVIYNEYVELVSYNDEEAKDKDDPKDLLKVTIESLDTGESITTLFRKE